MVPWRKTCAIRLTRRHLAWCLYFESKVLDPEHKLKTEGVQYALSSLVRACLVGIAVCMVEALTRLWYVGLRWSTLTDGCPRRIQRRPPGRMLRSSRTVWETVGVDIPNQRQGDRRAGAPEVRT